MIRDKVMLKSDLQRSGYQCLREHRCEMNRRIITLLFLVWQVSADPLKDKITISGGFGGKSTTFNTRL